MRCIRETTLPKSQNPVERRGAEVRLFKGGESMTRAQFFVSEKPVYSWKCLHWIVSAVFLLPTLSTAAPSHSMSGETIVTVPLSRVDVDQATATVSVLEDPLSDLNSFLKNCQSSLSEELGKETKDFSDDLRQFCQLTEKLAKRYWPPPTQHLEPKGYVITVPLKSPLQEIEALLWSTQSLDDAISFVSLLQGGNLKAIKVYTTVPWGPDPGTPCTECPIKELVFSAMGMKEQLEELRKKERQTGGPETP